MGWVVHPAFHPGGAAHHRQRQSQIGTVDQGELLRPVTEDWCHAEPGDLEHLEQLHVPGAVDRGWPGDDPGHGPVPDHVLRRRLAPAVPRHRLARLRVDAPAASRRGSRRREGGDQHEAPHPSLGSSLQQCRRTVHIDPVKLRLVPRGGQARHVIDDLHPGQCACHRHGVMQVTGGQRDAEWLEDGGPGRRADQRGDLITPLAQRLDEMTADEAGAAGDEAPHSGRS